MSDEPEFTDEPYRGTQILWGRVIVLLLALALAFWLGTTFGGDASAQSTIEEQQAEIARLKSQVTALEAEVAAVDAGGGEEEEGDASAEARPEPSQDDDSNEGANDSGDSNEGANDEDDDEAQPTDQESEAAPANAEGDVTEYVVQSGDSLAAIAQEVYGDPTLWREIAQANDLQEPYALTVGDTLDIPARPEP